MHNTGGRNLTFSLKVAHLKLNPKQNCAAKDRSTQILFLLIIKANFYVTEKAGVTSISIISSINGFN
jgi:hypothetical protein